MANPKPSRAMLADDNGNQLLTAQQDNVADAVVAHALADTFDDEESETALDALGVKINAILAILEEHGLMADS